MGDVGFHSSFLPNNYDSAKSFKFKDDSIQESKGLSKAGLAARRFLNIVSGGKIAVNPKLDKAITAVTNTINNSDTLLSYKEGSRIVNELGKLYDLADKYGSNPEVKQSINDAIKTIKENLQAVISEGKTRKSSEFTICTFNIGGSSADYIHTLKYAEAKKQGGKLDARKMPEPNLKKKEIDEKRQAAQQHAGQILAQKRPDIICLQEVQGENNWIDQTFNQNNDFLVVRARTKQTTGKGENKKTEWIESKKSDTAIVLNTKKFKFIENQSFFVRDIKDVALVIAEERSTGKKIAFMSAHLDTVALENIHGFSQEKFQEEQKKDTGIIEIEEILDKFNKLNAKYDHVVLGGDLNASAATCPHRFEQISTAGVQHFSSGETTEVYTGVYAKEIVERELDHILVGNADEKIQIKAKNLGMREISLEDPATCPSDHAPVYMKLKIVSNLKKYRNVLSDLDNLQSKIAKKEGTVPETKTPSLNLAKTKTVRKVSTYDHDEARKIANQKSLVSADANQTPTPKLPKNIKETTDEDVKKAAQESQEALDDLMKAHHDIFIDKSIQIEAEALPLEIYEELKAAGGEVKGSNSEAHKNFESDLKAHKERDDPIIKQGQEVQQEIDDLIDAINDVSNEKPKLKEKIEGPPSDVFEDIEAALNAHQDFDKDNKSDEVIKQTNKSKYIRKGKCS